MHAGTIYSTVRGSDWGWKDAPSLGLTQKREYLSHFDYVIILCPTLQYNKTYCQWQWFWDYPDIILIEPDNHMYDWIKKMGNLLAEWKTLFLIDNITADEMLNK